MNRIPTMISTYTLEDYSGTVISGPVNYDSPKLDEWDAMVRDNPDLSIVEHVYKWVASEQHPVD